MVMMVGFCVGFLIGFGLGLWIFADTAYWYGRRKDE